MAFSGLVPDYLGSGLLASRPAAPTLAPGTVGLYYCTDVGSEKLTAWDGAVWADIAGGGGGMTNPMTTAEDIIVGGVAGAPGRLGKGADGTFLGVVAGALTYTTPGGSGDVMGPASSVADYVALFDGATGKLLKQGSGTLATVAYSGAYSALSGLPTLGTVAALSYPGGTTTFLRADGTFSAPAGGGDVVGPGSATADAIVIFDGATGKLVKDSAKTIAALIAEARTPKVVTTVTSNTITPAADTDLLKATGLSAGLTIANYSATPADGWAIVVMLKDNGTSRALTWSSKWASMLATLPTATTISKWVVVTAVYDSTSDTYMCMSAQVQP